MNLLPSRHRRALAILRPLGDVDGVLGVALWDTGGNLLAHDLPDAGGSDALRAVGVRVAYLCASFSGEPGQFAGTMLVFAEHRLQLRVVGSVVIGVLMTADANTSALQMALHIAARQLTPEAVANPRAAADPDATADPAHSLGNHAEDRPSGGVRLYRGQRLPE